jgi:hypothetical protein
MASVTDNVPVARSRIRSVLFSDPPSEMPHAT